MKNDKGFSLIELIIVIAIMAILVGVLAPQFVKYIAKARRTVDVNNAAEYANAANVCMVLNNVPGINDVDAGESETEGVGTFAWSIEAVEAGAINIDNPQNAVDYFLAELGTVPVSKTNKDYAWYVMYDLKTLKIVKIYLMSATPAKAYQVYPDGSAFIENEYGVSNFADL